MSTQTFFEHAESLKAQTMGMRLSWNWLGTRKTLDPAQTHQIATNFQADPKRIRATKQLLDSKHKAIKDLTKLKGEVTEFVKAHSLPFPEDGIRLIKRNELASFQAYLSEQQAKLAALVEAANEALPTIIEEARQRLGELYNPTDYPSSLTGCYAFAWDFPSAEPPPYLQTLAPEIYERECERVRERFASAAQLAEDAFRNEFADLVGHLVERLTPSEDGTKKTFHATTVTNLTEFFGRFKALNITGSADLNNLVAQAEDVLAGRTADQLREDAVSAEIVKANMNDVKAMLDALVVTTSKRKIDRVAPPAPTPATEPTPTADPLPAFVPGVDETEQVQEQDAGAELALF